MIWSKLKIYAAATVASVIALLAAALKVRTAQYKKQKKKATVASKHAEKAVDTITHDIAVDVQEDIRLAEVANGSSDELLKPNSWD